MKRYIVVEGQDDKERITHELSSDQLTDISIVVAGGRSSAKMLGNSISVAKQAPVAIVIDADTTSEERIRDEEVSFQDMISMLPVSIPPVLFLAPPNVEIAFSSDDDFTKKLKCFVADEDYSVNNPFTFRR